MTKIKSLFLSLIFCFVLFFPVLALADSPAVGAYYAPGTTGYENPASQGWGGSATFASLVGQAIGYLNGIVFILGSVAIIFFLWGVAQYVYHAGAKPKRRAMLWSLLALFILFSIWGILRLMCNSLLLGTSCTTSPAPTTSSGSFSGSATP